MKQQRRSVPRQLRNRREVLLEAAARHFVQRGFEAASMRDIAADAGIQPSSIYHHFPSKEDLMLAVYAEGMRRITAAVRSAIDGMPASWRKLEAACAAHMRALLDGGNVFLALMRETPPEWHHANQRVAQLRDTYEAIFTGLLADLRFPKGTDRRMVRLTLLGAMNWSHHWYRAGRHTPATIARSMLGFLRDGLKVES